MSEDYEQGGFISGDHPAYVRIDPDECLIRLEDVAGIGLLCSRADHPTPSSDCTTKPWIRHRSEAE